MARPTKLTDEIIDLLVKGIKSGLTYNDAAQLAGIHKRTLERWRKKGELAKSGPYCRFYRSIKKAEVEARMILLTRINDASAGRQVVREKRVERNANGEVKRIVKITRTLPPVWQAAAWILERRYPDEFGRNAKPRVSESDDPFNTWIESLMEAENEFKGADIEK